MTQHENRGFKLSYAQNREDILMFGLFKNIEKGFYVDVGANHPTIDSVTKIFYDEGWSGINIEPIKSEYETLQKVRERDINLNVGILDKAGSKVFREYNNAKGLSSFSETIHTSYENKKSENTKKYKEYEVAIQTLKTIFESYNPKVIHFLKIDVEGTEKDVIKGNDWKKYRPWVVCIESHHSEDNGEATLKKNNYTYCFSDGINKYYVANEHDDLLKDFSYTDTILSKPVIDLGIKKMLDEEQTLRLLAEERLRRNELESSVLRSELNRLHNVVADSQRLKGSVKQLVHSLDKAAFVYIEKLNTPKTHTLPSSLLVKNSSDSAKILKLIRLYDFENYYVKNSGEKVLYRMVKTSYRGLTRVPLKVYRKVRLARRKV